MKTWGSGGIALIFLTSALNGDGQLHTPAVLPSRKEPVVSTGQEAGWAHCQSGRYGEETNLAPAWNRTPAVQAVDRRYTG
jgi:hypothetical protein